MSEKYRTLPVVAGAQPHLEQARKQLGGPYAADAATALAGRPARTAFGDGVVLYATATTADVYVGPRVVRRVGRHAIELLDDAETPVSLRTVASDVRRYAGIATGVTVRFRGETGHDVEGVLIEKCRFGGLVALADGRIVALGFGRIDAARLPE